MRTALRFNGDRVTVRKRLNQLEGVNTMAKLSWAVMDDSNLEFEGGVSIKERDFDDRSIKERVDTNVFILEEVLQDDKAIYIYMHSNEGDSVDVYKRLDESLRLLAKRNDADINSKVKLLRQILESNKHKFSPPLERKELVV